MTYDIRTLIRDTRILLDLNVCERCLIPPEHDANLDVDSMIRAMLVPAARVVMENADPLLLAPGKPIRALLAWPEDVPGVGMAVMPLPDDCLRLLAVRLTDWSRPARIMRVTDAEYAWQSSPFPGVRGNPDKPLAFICQRPTGMVAELYSSNNIDGVAVEMAQYVAVPRVDSDGTIRLPSSLYQSIIEQVAKMVRDILEQPNN